MLDTYRQVVTPEGVALHLRAAGPVPRALAYLVDLIARAAIYIALVQLLAIPFGKAGTAMLMLVSFALTWFYPVLFEALMQGRTPGKWALGLRVVAADGAQWRSDALAADRRAQQLGGQTVALDYKASDKSRTVAFRGYEYTRTPSDVSGALMTRYDESKPQVWNVPLKYDIQPSRQVPAPRGGYLVPAAQAAWVAAKLDQHGVEYRRLDAALSGAQVEAFRADKAEFSPQSSEGHQRNSLSGQWKNETQDLVAGALFVPIAQAKSRLVMALLEPQAPDSLAAWGEFNNAFERKEYMEDYVAEEVAREMLKDPKVKAEFETKLREDAAFAKSPQARLDFFYRRHTAWDERYNLYPVLRTETVPR